MTEPGEWSDDDEDSYEDIPDADAATPSESKSGTQKGVRFSDANDAASEASLQNFGNNSRVTYASFNGMSTHLLKHTNAHTTFSALSDAAWPRKAIKKGFKSLTKSIQNAPTSPIDGGSEAEQKTQGDLKVTLPPGATSTSLAKPLVWTDADVSAVDWRTFVIPPPEPPPPPPPLSLRERLMGIYKLDEEVEAPPKEDSDSEKEDEWGADVPGGDTGASPFDKKARLTLKERITRCPLHSQPRVNDQTWARLMLDRHENLNKKTIKLMEEGEDESSSDVSSSNGSGVDVQANDREWEVMDPKYLMQERDRLKMMLNKAEEDLDVTQQVNKDAVRQMQRDLRKLQHALGVPAREDAGADYDELVREAALKAKNQSVQRSPTASPVVVPPALRPAASTVRSVSEIVSEEDERSEEKQPLGFQGSEEQELLWAERQLGFMGVHRDNTLERKKDILEHIAVMKGDPKLRKDGLEAEAALQILLAHQHKADRETDGALAVLARLGINWYDVDLKKDILAAEVEALNKMSKMDDIIELKRAETLAEKYLQSHIDEALHAVRPSGMTEKRLFMELGSLKGLAEEMKFQGRGDAVDEMFDGFSALRKRRRARILHAHSVFEKHGGTKSMILELKARKIQAEVEKLNAKGRRLEATRLEKVVEIATDHRSDAEEWASKVLKTHSIDLSKQGAYVKAKSVLANMADPSRRAELKLAWDIVERPAETHEDKLLASDQEFDMKDAKEGREKRTKKKRSESIIKEVTRLVRSGKFSVEKVGGKKLYTDNAGNAVDIFEVARKSLEKKGANKKNRRVSIVGERQPGESLALDDVDVEIAPFIPFTNIVRQELDALQGESEFIGEEGSLAAEARRRAKERVKESDARTRRRIRVSDGKGVAAVKVVKVWDQEGMVAEEVERMMRVGEWRKDIDERNGKEHFVNSKTGEVQFSLKQIALSNLEKENILVSDDDADSSDSGPEYPDEFTHKEHKGIKMGGRRRSNTIDSDDPYNNAQRITAYTPGESVPIPLTSRSQDKHNLLRSRLVQYLRRNDAAKVDRADAMLEGWKGNEEALFRYLDRYYDQKRRGVNQSPLRDKPKKQQKDAQSSQQAKLAAVAKVIEQNAAPPAFRKLLIKLYAAQDPQMLRAVGSEVQQHSHDSESYLAGLVEHYGVDSAHSAWISNDTAKLRGFGTASDVLEVGLRRLAGGEGHGSNGQVAPSQLSPLFDHNPQAEPPSSPRKFTAMEDILDATLNGTATTDPRAQTQSREGSHQTEPGVGNIRYVQGGGGAGSGVPRAQPAAPSQATAAHSAGVVNRLASLFSGVGGATKTPPTPPPAAPQYGQQQRQEIPAYRPQPQTQTQTQTQQQQQHQHQHQQQQQAPVHPDAKQSQARPRTGWSPPRARMPVQSQQQSVAPYGVRRGGGVGGGGGGVGGGRGEQRARGEDLSGPSPYTLHRTQVNHKTRKWSPPRARLPEEVEASRHIRQRSVSPVGGVGVGLRPSTQRHTPSASVRERVRAFSDVAPPSQRK